MRRSDRIWYWNEELISEFDKIRNHFGNSLLSQCSNSGYKRSKIFVRDVKNLAWQGGNLPNCSIKRFICDTICDKLCCYRLRKDGKFANQIMNGLLEAKLFVRKPVVAPLDRTIRVTVGRDEEIDLLKNVLPDVLKALR